MDAFSLNLPATEEAQELKTRARGLISELMLSPLTPQVCHVSKAHCGHFTQNCCSDNTQSHCVIAYHILMILQCPAPCEGNASREQSLSEVALYIKDVSSIN